MGDDNDLIRRGDIFSAVNKAMWQNIDIRDAIAALPAAPAEDVRAANRVTYNDDGTLDEIVTDAGVHLEALGGNGWFLGAARSDGTEIRVWIRGKVTLIEDDAKEAKP